MMQPSLCIVGLGYVGLPLAHAFAKAGYAVTGYDVSATRIAELNDGIDRTNELTNDELAAVSISYTTDPSVIKEADIIILALPTPVDERNNPDLTLLTSASETVGTHLKQGAIVVYESTVYPGVTEDICGPVLERASGMTCGKDFFLGYSPERINPGDREHTVATIVKIVAGQNEHTTDTLCTLYGSIVKAGIHRAPSIKVAEMAKAIENAQRDLNIAYINEIAMLCNRIGIRSSDVLEAAATKWNFLRFQPGLVGGHCIGVDPYYLVEKARQLNMQSNVISAGRAVNDGMGAFVATHVLNTLGKPPTEARLLILGLTFKENVPDTRNSRVKDVIAALAAAGAAVEVHDPYVEEEEIRRKGWQPGSRENGPYDALLLLVPHEEYLREDLSSLLHATKENGVVYDLKSMLDGDAVVAAGRIYLSL